MLCLLREKAVLDPTIRQERFTTYSGVATT
jgi:hypothetical protein